LVVRTLSGLKTVMGRRGVGYFGYLLTGVTAPRLAYEFLWGPAAPAPFRALFGEAARRLCPEVPIDAAFDPGHSSASVEAAMDRAHAAGLTGTRYGFDGHLTALRRHPDRGALFAAERDADRRAFNARFDASILTEESARRLLRELRARVTTYHDYAPIDFGGGLTIGQVASSDSGTGRWDVFNRRVVAPLVEGRRVLDLGCNNGSMPLMMLRAGARSVVGIEGSPEIADVARLNGRILAWRDIRPYDFRVVTGDMRLCLTDDFGPVDVVTAFCSLYYLPEADMARVIRKAAAMGATLVLQANEAIDNLPAGGATLRRLMEANGYPGVETHAFRGFARPLLVGAGAGR
jgi:SAM-dependent methyltransferase